jgi:DNA replicative helicase MCM subunit Mcm2 (Cdc46/Mcm family)
VLVYWSYTTHRDDPEAALATGAGALGNIAADFSEEERNEIATMGRSADLYRKLCASIAPTVFSHMEVRYV